MSSRDTNGLWQDFFRDPSQFWDHRSTKKNLRSPDFRHKETKAALWIHGWYNPPWVQDSLARFMSREHDIHTVEIQGFSDLSTEIHDRDALLEVIKACGKRKDLVKARKVHTDILQQKVFSKDIYVGTSLLNMYAKCGSMKEAQQVFDELPVRDVVSWSSLVAGYAKVGRNQEALNCFRHMCDEGISPDAVTFTNILKACANSGSIKMGEEIHAEVNKNGLLEKDIVLGTTLVDMYAKCGELEKARDLFEKLPEQNVVSWNALISGYVQHGLADEALTCYRQMQNEGISPDAVTYTCILKSCSKGGSLNVGEEIHEEIKKHCILEKDIMLGNALVDMYVKCGMLERAQESFEALPLRDVVSWSTLIGGYVQHGHANRALNCFKQMQDAKISSNAITLTYLLKACSCTGSLELGEEMHLEIRKQGLIGKDIVIGNALVDMYAKCGALKKAQEVFEQLPVQNAVSWSTLITGYVQHGFGDDALKCFRKMLDKGITPDAITLICALKACSSTKSLEIGEQIHAKIQEQDLLAKDIILGNALVDMYCKCAAFDKAEDAFQKLPIHDSISWSVLIHGYAQHGLNDEALDCFRQMQDVGIFPDAVIFICILKVCSSSGHLKIGEDIYAEVKKNGLLEKDIVLGNALLDMYAKCGEMVKAVEVFEGLLIRDVITWSTLIAGYIQNGNIDGALNSFKHMQDEGLHPDAVTFSCILKACGIKGFLQLGEEIHDEINNRGLLEKDVVLGNTLVDMYVKCGMLEKAQKLFDGLPVRDVVSWSALIAGYTQDGRFHEAIHFFRKMQEEEVPMNSIVFTCILNACSSTGSLELGEEIHAKIEQQGLLETDIMLGNALVGMYSKCGMLEKAQKVFDELPRKDVVSWSALVAGYAQHGLGNDALNCFRQMRNEQICPDAVTFTCVLKACGSTGSLEIGEEIHTEIKEQGLLEKEPILGTALLDMYAKCGMVRKAQEIFDELPVRDVVSWSALMAGYAQLGHARRVLDLFGKMPSEGVIPDLVTFNVVLSACNHAGLVEEGQNVFDDMNIVYSVIPSIEHYNCMVELFSRAGHFDRAITVIRKVPSSDRLPLLLALLGACHKWSNVEIGQWTFERILQLDEKCAVAYVCMGNIYTAAGMYKEAEKIEAEKLKTAALRKVAGSCWWTDSSKIVHSFTMGDKSHPQSLLIYAKLEDIYRNLSDHVPDSVLDEGLEEVSCDHSERLAISCALISTPPGTPIRIAKNTHMCDNCHFVISFISKTEGCRIQVKDARRIHIFENGKCVCEDHAD